MVRNRSSNDAVGTAAIPVIRIDGGRAGRLDLDWGVGEECGDERIHCSMIFGSGREVRMRVRVRMRMRTG